MVLSAFSTTRFKYEFLQTCTAHHRHMVLASCGDGISKMSALAPSVDTAVAVLLIMVVVVVIVARSSDLYLTFTERQRRAIDSKT